MTIAEIIRNSKISPLDAEILLSLAANRPKEYLFTHPEYKLSPAELKKFNSFAKRRQKGKPIAYLTGKKEFYGLEFLVNKNVLIPRPETELLVEKTLNQILDTKYQIPDTIIDVGAGSGNIVISIVKNLPAAARKKINFYATDISKKALFVAKKNAKRRKVTKNIKLIRSDLLEYFIKNKVKFENLLIVANLPYISHRLYKKNKNGLKYEPINALISDKSGLRHYEKLIKQVKNLLFVDHCLLIIEISPEQKNGLARIVKRELPAAKIKFFKDFARKTRTAGIEANPAPIPANIPKNPKKNAKRLRLSK